MIHLRALQDNDPTKRRLSARLSDSLAGAGSLIPIL
jgi:hypothetical protein